VFHLYSAFSTKPFFRNPSGILYSKAPTMNRNPYTRLSHIYIRLIRSYSPAASQALEKILNTHGPRATYYAALGLARLANRAKGDAKIDSDEFYAHHLSDMPEVMPLYQEAAGVLLSDMGQVKVNDLSTSV